VRLFVNYYYYYRWSLAIPEMNNIRFISAQQAKDVYQNKTIKEESIKQLHQCGLTWHDNIKCFTIFTLQPKSATLSNLGMSNIRFISAQKARGNYQYKNINEKSVKGMHHCGWIWHDSKHFTWFALQPKPAPEMGWWLGY
jgi:hypothetical protein